MLVGVGAQDLRAFERGAPSAAAGLAHSTEGADHRGGAHSVNRPQEAEKDESPSIEPHDCGFVAGGAPRLARGQINLDSDLLLCGVSFRGGGTAAPDRTLLDAPCDRALSAQQVVQMATHTGSFTKRQLSARTREQSGVMESDSASREACISSLCSAVSRAGSGSVGRSNRIPRGSISASRMNPEYSAEHASKPPTAAMMLTDTCWRASAHATAAKKRGS